MRYKGYTIINILGFSIGLSCCILIALFIKHELSYDRYNEKADRIYRIVSMISENGESRCISGTPAPLAQAIQNEYPEVLQTTRVGSGLGDVITYGNIQTRNNRFGLADPSVFDIFTITLIKGNPQNVLSDLNSVVISENLARKYFGDEDPIGKILQIGREGYNKDYKVSGVFKTLPPNSCLQFDCLASFQNLYIKGNGGNLAWRSNNYKTFVLLQKNYNPLNFESKLPGIVEKYLDSEPQSDPKELKTKYLLQPLTSIHLSLNPGNKFPTDRDSTYIFIFAGIALLILFIACINFMNLATARASLRVKEVGVRKVIGANRIQLVKQFLGESILTSQLALLLSIPIVKILLPVFNQYTEKQLSLFQADNIFLLISLPVIVLIVAVFAGSYPALFLSSFKPVSILSGRLFGGKAGTKAGLRRILVVVQFVISIIFVMCTLVMHNQLHYVMNKNLGYDKEHLIVVPIYNDHVKAKYDLYKTEILRNANILNATATSFLPSELGYYQNVDFKGAAKESLSYIDWISVDKDFIETMGLKLIGGRNFSQDEAPVSGVKYLLNESAAKQIGLENPLGEQMDIIGLGPVIGVIKDFNFKSLYHQIKPMALCVYPAAFKYLLIRVGPEQISNSISFLKDKWAEIYSNQVFEYNFFDEDFNELYKAEIRSGDIFNFITVLAMLVACLGLFGLIHFSTEQRTKEIGIRKVLGCSVLEVVVMLTKDFVKWVFIASIIALPIAYYFMNEWLQDFAYRINISWWMFALSGGIALVIALATVSVQAIKAANANPIDSLRYE